MADVRAQLARLASTLGRARVARQVAGALGWGLLPVASLALSHVVLGVPSYTGLLAVALVTLVVAVLAPWFRGHVARVTPTDAALWVERREPRLQWTLVTIADAEPAVAARLEPHVRAVPWEGAAFAEARGRLVRGATLLAVSAAGFALAMVPWRRHPEAAATILGDAPVPANVPAALRPGALVVRARLVPPAYTGTPARDLALDGATVDVLEGTRLELAGDDGAGRVRIGLREAGEEALRAVGIARDGDAWRATVRAGTVPLAVRLADGVGERWVTLAARPDSAPAATLDLPAADLVTRDTTLAIAVRGRARDDVGVREVRIEWIRTTGGGEQFKATSGALAVRRGALGRDVAVQGTLSLAALGVRTGDVLHLRIAALDGNTVRGPQLGASDTRVIRIPREEDSVAVEQLPPSPVDTNAVSQRMLVVFTERLVARERALAREPFLAESRRIGLLQGRLRRQVGAIVFMRTGDEPSGEHAHFAGDGHEHTAGELASLQKAAPTSPEAVLAAAERATTINAALDSHGDETPVVAINRPLLEAYNAMWEATRALETGEPRAALPPMRRALEAIQRARAAERLYLRGVQAPKAVDVAKVRLTGTDSARFEARTPLPALALAGTGLAARLDRALIALGAGDAGAVDSLRLVRLDALVARPALARALDDALARLARGGDATEPLRRARRLAAPVAGGDGADPRWSGGLP